MTKLEGRELPAGLVYAAYLAAFVFVLISFADLVIISWPSIPTSVEWRVGAVGTFGQVVTFPTLVLVLAALLAGVMEHRVVLVAVSVTALGIGLAAWAGVGIFALDAIETRSTLVPDIRGTFTRQIFKTCMNLFLYGSVNCWVAVAGIRSASRARERQAREGEAAKSPRIVSSKSPVVPAPLNASQDA